MSTHNEKAAARVQAAVTSGAILKASNVLGREETTIGPYHEAVDRGVRFAVIGWKTGATTFKTLEEAAVSFVNRVGSTRAREAAIKAV